MNGDSLGNSTSNEPLSADLQLYLCVCVAVAQLVEALRYKLEGRGFDSRWCH